VSTSPLPGDYYPLSPFNPVRDNASPYSNRNASFQGKFLSSGSLNDVQSPRTMFSLFFPPLILIHRGIKCLLFPPYFSPPVQRFGGYSFPLLVGGRNYSISPRPLLPLLPASLKPPPFFHVRSLSAAFSHFFPHTIGWYKNSFVRPFSTTFSRTRSSLNRISLGVCFLPVITRPFFLLFFFDFPPPLSYGFVSFSLPVPPSPDHRSDMFLPIRLPSF